MKKNISIKPVLLSLLVFLLTSALFSSFLFALPRAKQNRHDNIKISTLDLTFKPDIDLTIIGLPLATKEQCLNYLLRQNSLPLLTVSPRELVDHYYEEALREGVRPDVAFAQALHETGNFRYGGDVIPIQNNYCGLGTIGGGVKGAFFPTAQIGVRAQIQHLLAYATKRPPILPIVDPRYELVKNSNTFGNFPTWISLNGKWAVPGTTYGQKILRIHQKILTERVN